jgi:uncharacterized protein (DUF952 family)
MPIIYHVTTGEEWNTAKQKGFYESASLKQEGFIHCSQEDQVAAVLERYFAGKKGLVKLVIDTDKLTCKYVFEWSPSTKDTFPHVYGPVNMEAVVSVTDL